jgi:hypothetical protein
LRVVAMVDGFVALSLSEFFEVEKSRELRPDIFCGWHPWGDFVPLDLTVEWAVHTAMGRCTPEALAMVERPTSWMLLQLTFNDAAIARAFKEGILHWSAGQHYCQWWSSIDLSWIHAGAEDLPALKIIMLPVCQVDLSAWGDCVLGSRLALRKLDRSELSTEELCAACARSTNGLWRAPRSAGAGWYCAECWHMYCKGKSSSMAKESPADAEPVHRHQEATCSTVSAGQDEGGWSILETCWTASDDPGTLR